MTIGRIPSVEGGIQPTIVDAKGDLIAGVAADSVNRLAVGSNDQVLVADSATTSGLAWKSVATPFAAGKNKIINGDFGIWQRGTSTTVLANTTAFVSDRWRLNVDNTSGGSAVVTRQSFSPGSAPVPGYEGIYFCQIANTAGSTASRYFWQTIEDVQTFAGQIVTLSFFAKASSATNIDVKYQQNFGSGGSSAVNGTFNSGTALTTSWQRFSYTITLPSISGKTIGTSSYIYVLFEWLNTVSTTIQIWGVQLEAGNTATAFQTATGTLQGELAACQRYYWRIPASATATFQVFSNSGWFNGTTTFEAVHRMPVTMRVAPTTLDWAGTLNVLDTAGSSVAVSAGVISGAESNGDTVRVNWTVSGATSGRFGNLRAPGSATAFVGFGAEL